MNRRLRNIEIFEDTLRLCQSHEKLAASIESSLQGWGMIPEDADFQESEEHRYEQKASVVVSKKRSFAAAREYAGKRVCVHNFASATNPGGGVSRGSGAQEECLCRCSTLYPVLSSKEVVQAFHNKHRRRLKEGNMTALYNDDCVYAPGITVFKSDTSEPELLPEEQWYQVDVITAAAPNLRERPSNSMNPGSGTKKPNITMEELKKLHVKRMSRVMEIARFNQAESLILGAFGCGAFRNPPQIVAEAICEVVKRYQYDFEVIEFAVYCPPGDLRNYEIFRDRLEGM